MTSAAIYLRQSLDVPEGIERQRSRCMSLLKARGWDFAEQYVDNDTSASKVRGSKTAWSRMLADGSARKFDVVVAVDLDRLLRNVRDLMTLTETGIKVLTVDGEIDLTSADGEFRATMLAGIARFEVRRKGERQKRANQARAARGAPSGGRRAFGYESDGITVREPEAVLIREAYAAVLAGVTLTEIARQWNAAGVVSAQKRYKAGHEGEPSPWRRDSVRAVLLNPRNMGKRAHLGEIVADGEWPALVLESTWLAASALLTDSSRLSARVSSSRYLLSGLAVCGVCGSPVHAGASARPGIRSYRCSGSTGHVARMAEPVEDYVTAVIVARLARADARDLFSDRQGPDVDALREEAIAVRSRLESLAIDFADGSLTGGQLRTATERLRARLAELEGIMASAGRVDVLGPLVGSEDVRGVWDALGVSRQRVIVDLLTRVTIHPPGRGTRTFRPESVAIAWRS